MKQLKYGIAAMVLVLMATMISCNDDRIMNEEEESVMQDLQKHGVDMPLEKLQQLMKEAKGESPKYEGEEVFKVVEEMPRFPGCDEAYSDGAKQCAIKKMLTFIYGNLKYPEVAKINGVEGVCVASFVVEKDGSLSNIRVVRNIGAGCGDETLRVVNLMNGMPQKWIPGKQRGEAVRVQFNLPVKFRLPSADGAKLDKLLQKFKELDN